MTRMASALSLLLLAAGLASAADSMSAPVAGYIAGAPRPELRAILGVPGSFLLSDPLPLPEGVTRVRVAPGQGYALVDRKDGGPAAAVLSGADVARVVPLEGVMSGAEWIAFSLQARSAVFASAGRLQVVTGLPDAARVAFELDAGALPEMPVTAAVSDDGSLVLVASSQSVYLVSSGAAPQLLMSGGDLRSLAVMPNGTDAAVLDRSNGSIHLLSNAGSGAAARVLASGLGGAARITPAYDGQSVFVSRPQSAALSWVDVASGQVQSFDTASMQAPAPLELMPLRNRDTFLISARPRQPAWIFYRDGSVGRVAFIPAVAGRTSSR
jgi:hypothetical protein